MAGAETVDEFLESLEGYSPIIPDGVTAHLLKKSGFSSPSLHLTRLVSVSAHKFLAEVVSDAMQYCKMRQAGAVGKDTAKGKGPQGRDKRLVLTSEDLAAALKEFGVNVRRPDYFVDGPLVGPKKAVPLPPGKAGAGASATHTAHKGGFASMSVGDGGEGYGL